MKASGSGNLYTLLGGVGEGLGGAGEGEVQG